MVAWYSFSDLGGTIGGEGDILYSVSSDDGANFSWPAPLNPSAGTDSSNDVETMQALASDGASRWLATWVHNPGPPNPYYDWDLRISHSDDRGKSWSLPQPLEPISSGIPSGVRNELATDGRGHWMAVWMSSRDQTGLSGGDFDIYAATSSDNGSTFTARRPVNQNQATDTGEDKFPDIATDGHGTWICVWATNDTWGGAKGSDYDVAFAKSIDFGSSWTSPTLIDSTGYSDSWDDGAINLGLVQWGPRIATDGKGTWITVWSTVGGPLGTDPDILFARSVDAGATWTAAAPLNSNASADLVSGTFRADENRQITTDGLGNWVCVWETQAFTTPPHYDFDLAISRSVDNGLTWSPIAPLNSYYQSDTGWDYSPQIATDGRGRWMSVWFTSEPTLGGGGGIFGETDIAYAISTYLGPPATTPDVVNYLIGRSNDPEGLDLNGDGKIDSADVILAARRGGLGAGLASPATTPAPPSIALPSPASRKRARRGGLTPRPSISHGLGQPTRGFSRHLGGLPLGR